MVRGCTCFNVSQSLERIYNGKSTLAIANTNVRAIVPSFQVVYCIKW